MTSAPSWEGVCQLLRARELDVQLPIETYGVGARGLNLYDGSQNKSTVGIQVTRPLPVLAIHHGVTTCRK